MAIPKGKKKKVVRSAPRHRRGEKVKGPSFEGYEKLSGEEFHSLRRRAIDFYYENYKPSDLLTYAYQWMKAQEYSKSDIASAKKGYIPPTASIYAKVLIDGCPDFYEPHGEHWASLAGTSSDLRPISEFLKKHIEIAIAQGSLIVEEQKAEEAKKNTGPVLTIQQKLRIASMAYATELETEIDEIIDSISEFNVKDYNPVSTMRKLEIKANHARIIKEYFEPMVAEFIELTGPKKKDNDLYDQLVEGYSHIPVKDQKKILALYVAVTQACDMIITSQKAVRTRTKKPVSKEKLVAKLKYQTEDAGLKLASISPLDILDATELWVYNTKTRKLGKYVVDDMYGQGAKLGVKGTSIVGFNEAQSVQKTLRKPAEQLAELKKAGKVVLRKFMDDIKTTQTKLNGRINDQTILLKVAK